MKILVTGAGGYIGTTLVPHLLAAGHVVTALDLFLFGEDRLADHPHLTRLKMDARDTGPAHFAGQEAVIDLVGLSNDATGETFAQATHDINFLARLHTAQKAKAAGVARYLIPTSCSAYGFQPPEVIADEQHPINPLTTYAKANAEIEQAVIAENAPGFAVTVLRLCTLFGASARMRFDLAINGMTEGALRSGKLPLMRDGTQWRPFIHVKDVARAFAFVLGQDPGKIAGQIFNTGRADMNLQIGPLAETVRDALAETTGKTIAIEWYGDPDHRSYRVDFSKLMALGFTPQMSARDGVAEIATALEDGTLRKDPQSLTLDWYRHLLAEGVIDQDLRPPT